MPKFSKLNNINSQSNFNKKLSGISNACLNYGHSLCKISQEI